METKQHKHHDVMVALAGNPYLVIEYRGGNSDWHVCEYPAFNPEYQYRIQCDIAVSEHYELLRLFASNADLQFQRQAQSADGGWIDVPSTQIKWGSNTEYRIKPVKEFRIGDMVRSSITGMVLVVTGPVVGDRGFTGTILKDDAYAEVGVTRKDWDEDCFELIDNPFLEVQNDASA